MVKSVGRHCNDVQSTKPHRCDCLIFWRRTKFYEPSAQLAGAGCCWTAQLNSFFPFPCQPLYAACLVAPAHKLTKNRCFWWHAGGKLWVRIAKTAWLIDPNDRRWIPPRSHGSLHQWLTRSIVCFLWNQRMTTSRLAESSACQFFF